MMILVMHGFLREGCMPHGYACGPFFCIYTLKVAGFAAATSDYKRAIEIYEQARLANSDEAHCLCSERGCDLSGAVL